ncbi:MAG: hypothetical protein LUQ36_11130 [Methanoregula sp.]|nr:hypothetical protein [Methanoregula sp.]
MSNKAQNGNKGSILAYSLFGRFMVTGLIGALLTSYFQIPGIWAWNPKSPILRGGPPALLFPFGWQIVVQMGRSREKKGKRPVLRAGFFRDQVLGCCGEGNGGEGIATYTLPEGLHFLDLIRPDLVQKMANSDTYFKNIRIIRLFQENTADYRFKMYANRRFWRADLRGDRPLLPTREQNTAMGVFFWIWIR